MSELINGRTPEEIKIGLRTCQSLGMILGGCGSCPYKGCDGDCDLGLEEDALALIERLESERDAAIRDLKLISHCYTCSNQDLDKHGECKNSGGGGAPFMKCPGYVWDKKLPCPPKEGESC